MIGAILLALSAGAMLPVQAAMNARLGRVLGSPIWAAAFSGAVLTAVLVVAGFVATRGPRVEGTSQLPWWAWTGGLCGCVVLTATTAATPRLGAATMVAMVVVGQVVCSLTLDRFGLFGLDSVSMTLRRVAAAILLVAGAALIR